MRALSYIGAEKITFIPKPDGRTDISNYKRFFATQKRNEDSNTVPK